MAYIDLDEINRLHPKLTAKYPLSFANGISAAINEINRLPNADVVPKSEVDKLEYTLLGVMHSVDKWLEGDELKQDEVNRAITMREKTLRIIENAKSEVAREIFEEIERLMLDGAIGGRYAAKVINPDKYAELKKKYTGVEP